MSTILLRVFCANRFFISLFFGVLVFLPGFAYADTGLAAAYLQGHTQNPWVTMALSALGEAPDVSYLRSAHGSTAVELEAPILALAAAGESPYTYPENDLVAALKSFYAGGQIGDPALLNDDIFGILALVSAGVSEEDPVVAGAKEFVLTRQNTDGGWPYAAGGTSDTNTTAAAIMALVASGDAQGSEPIQNALAYLRVAQNTDGGFPYDPQSSWGTASDASSDAWVLMALTAASVDQSSFAASSTTKEHLLSLQIATTTPSTGYFEYQQGSGEDSFTPVTTAYAVLALLGKTLPVAKVAPPPPPSAPTPEPPSPEPTPSSSGGGGGNGIIGGPLAVGFQVQSEGVQSDGGLPDTQEVLGAATSTFTDVEPEAATTTVENATSTLTIAQIVQKEPAFPSNLRFGMRGDDVARLQAVLIGEKYLEISAPTGWFGPLTLFAVQRYQAVWGIMPTGFVGPVTRAWLNVHLSEPTSNSN